jgi:hypothetical protein
MKRQIGRASRSAFHFTARETAMYPFTSARRGLYRPFIALAIAIAMSASASDDPLPPLQNSGAIAYRSGGVGLDESAAMKADAPNHALTLLFASRIGTRYAYIAGVDVAVAMADGTPLLTTVSNGPYLSIDLPSGTYRISVVYQNKPRNQTVALSRGHHQQAVFAWVDDQQTE